MAFDPDKYLQEKTGSESAAFDPDRYLAEKTGQAPDQPGLGARALQWVGHQLERVPAAIRGGVQAYQTHDPYSAADMAWQGFKDPSSVQTSEQMMGRFGADTTPYPVSYPTQGTNNPAQRNAPIPYLPAQSGTSSHAQAAGEAFDALAPTGLELIPGAAGMAKGAAKAAGMAEKTAVSAAEKAILEHYNPTFMKEMAPAISGSSTIADAPAIVAQKLREHDLLYTPGKANFNLKRDLKQTGEQIGSVVQQAKQKDVAINVQKVVDDFMASKQKALNETGEGAASFQDMQNEIAPRIQAMVDQLKPNELGEVPIDKAVNFRRSLQDMVKNWGDQGGKPIIQGAAKELQSSLNQAIELSDPRLGPKLAGLNNKFSDLKDLQPLIEDAYTRGFGKSASGKVAQSGVAKALDAVIGENGKPLLKSALRAAASPVKTVLGVKPEWAEALANRNRFPYPDMYASEPLPSVPADALQAIKAPFIQDAPAGLPPRVSTMRRALESNPAYVPVQNDAAPGLPPRQPSLQPQRRPISPIAPDPSLDVSQLGAVLDADAAKEIASTQYQGDRLKVLWKKVQEAKSPKQRTALMNLIRSVHKATPSK